MSHSLLMLFHLYLVSVLYSAPSTSLTERKVWGNFFPGTILNDGGSYFANELYNHQKFTV